MDIASHNRKLFHVGKYVFAPETLLPFRRGETKQYNFMTIDQLRDRFPSRVEVHNLDNCPEQGRPRDGQAEGKAQASYRVDRPRSFVATIDGGWCHGRNCDWVGLENHYLQELRYIAGRLRAKDFSHGYLDPRFLRRLLTTPRRLPRPTHLRGTVVVLNKVASHNYFHWLSEVLPRIELVKRAGLLSADAYIVDCHKPFQLQSLELLGIPLQKIIQPHEGLLVQAERLIVPSFYSADSRRRLGQLIRSAIGLQDSGNPEFNHGKIYISRRHSKNRVLQNDTEVSRYLDAHDFETHHLEQYSLIKQIRLLHQTGTVVGLHGAGLTNVLFSPASAGVLEIRPERCNRTCFSELADDLGHRHEIVSAKQPKRRGPIHCSLSDLEDALERINRQPVRKAA
ncbi:MAG: glycosyltransferase family 61 protein [Rhodopirellula sp. JB053]|uniref:glycosyltransferase family 61 protein n=1 Tax=Rhodopirellula sp. JB044 TaxID=3342844 RepID=UPI00370B4C7B